MKEPRQFMNLSSDDPCEVCFNEGWAPIKGWYRIHGYSYSNGSAPCRWCELGGKTMTQARKRGFRLSEHYTIEQVDGYDPNVEYLPKAVARRLVRELIAGQHQLPHDQQDLETQRLVHLQLEARARNYAPPQEIRP